MYTVHLKHFADDVKVYIENVATCDVDQLQCALESGLKCGN